MRHLLKILLFPLALHCQALLTVTGPNSITAGKAGTFTLTLSGSAGLNITSLQWQANWDTAGFVGVVAPGAATIASSNTIWCSATNMFCIAAGYSNTTPPLLSTAIYQDGVVATFPIHIPASVTGPIAVWLSNLQAVTTQGIFPVGGLNTNKTIKVKVAAAQ